ncbi:peptidoglycan-associated lipoprotein Pal [Oxalobacteraceae bacterium OM1]|nr:peptidoglycan-associated lipoprotein Pal [Oxalobacteraceae bacterium OM1]
MHSLKNVPVILSALLALAACSTTKLNDKPVTDAKPAAAPAATTAAVAPAAVDPLNDPKSGLAKRSVYFDYDKYEVKRDYQPTVSAHGQYLSSHKDRKIVIQGNADERGSSEYNLALGQKRAEVVRKQLAGMGVPDSQMEAVSFGKEKPKATGHDETAWAENRRADIVYDAK